MEMECLHVKTTTAIPDVKCTWPPSQGEGGNSPGGAGAETSGRDAGAKPARARGERGRGAEFAPPGREAAAGPRSPRAGSAALRLAVLY